MPLALPKYAVVFAAHFVFFLLCYGLYRLKIKLIHHFFYKSNSSSYDRFGAPESLEDEMYPPSTSYDFSLNGTFSMDADMGSDL